MFELDKTLEGDSIAVTEDDDFIIRLVNDARFPWVLIVPKVQGATELHDLDQDMFARTMSIARAVGVLMKAAFRAHKVNTAALGNSVSQLHVHVIARTTADAAWPRPIWGVGDMEPLDEGERERRLQLLRQADLIH